MISANEAIGKTYNGREIKDASDIADIMINDFYVAMIPCADFGFPDHFRLSYAISLEQIKKGMDRFDEFTSQLQ